jgi:hypothetical protein
VTIEIIVVDDEPTDAAWPVIRDGEARDRRRHGARGGATAGKHRSVDSR